MTENILVVKTKRWADAIIYRNYLYNFNCRNKNGSIYFVCKQEKCKAAITMNNDLNTVLTTKDI